MKVISLALSMLFLGLFTMNAQAIDLQLAPKGEIRDVTSYAIGLDRSSRAATGLCGGSLASFSHEGRWIGNLLTPCVFGGVIVDSGEQSNTSAILGLEMVNLLGIRFGMGYVTEGSHNENDWTYLVGISLSDLGKRLVEDKSPVRLE